MAENSKSLPEIEIGPDWKDITTAAGLTPGQRCLIQVSGRVERLILPDSEQPRADQNGLRMAPWETGERPYEQPADRRLWKRVIEGSPPVLCFIETS